jgi:acetylornithine/succinyldiaminopimelate/putrescine aminotransferase
MSNATETHLPFGGNYAREMVVFTAGNGVYLSDRDGNQYLDFGAGIAVNALGYGRQDLADAAAEQIARLMHVSNLFATEPALQLAGTLRDLASRQTGQSYEAVYFGNSGTEANEAALKFARLRSLRRKGPGHHRFLCFRNGFHGRTFGSLSVTPTEKYQAPFGPLLSDVSVLDFNDTTGLENTLSREYAAVIVEAVQGEGGLAVMSPDFARTLTEACRRHDVLLVLDEIQTGLGRTGPIFAAEKHGLLPDIITLSKPLAAGLPLSATIMTGEINSHLSPGDHGSTFGGGPVVCAVANEVIRLLTDPAFRTSLTGRIEVLDRELQALHDKHPCIREVKGMGMLRGLEIREAAGSSKKTGAEMAGSVIAEALKNGLILLRSGTNVIRIAPPLVISPDEIRHGVQILSRTISDVTGTA